MISEAEEMMRTVGMRLAAVGVEWDVVKVRRFLAVRAIERLPEPGAVAVDPTPAEPALYFFVPAGSAADWDVPQTTALGLNAHVVLPPKHKEAPPGPYWLIPAERGLTQAATLRQALEQTISCTPAPSDQRTPDIGAMRVTAAELLGEESVLPRWQVVQALANRYRADILLLIPAVEDLAARRPKDDVRARTARAGIGEARRRLNEIEAVGLVGEVKRAQRLGRSVIALCNHYDSLTGQQVCLACDQPIESGEESVPHDQISPSGGAERASRVHARCVNPPRS